MGHGPQRRVSSWEAPPKDDPVVQAVGLALPELHHLWVQDVATPTKRSRGFSALCIFPAVTPTPTVTPRTPEEICWDLSNEGSQGGVDHNSIDRVTSSKHQGPDYQVSLTSILASAPLVPGRASPVPHFSFSDTVQGKEMEEGPDLVNNSFNNHLLSMCSVPGAGDTGEKGRLTSVLQEHSPTRGSDRHKRPISLFSIPFSQGDHSCNFVGVRGPWHPLETASGDKPRPSSPGGLKGSPTHLPVGDHRTLVTDHSPNLAALGAGVEVARGLLLRQLLHRALHTDLLRDGPGYMAFNVTDPPYQHRPHYSPSSPYPLPYHCRLLLHQLTESYLRGGMFAQPGDLHWAHL